MRPIEKLVLTVVARIGIAEELDRVVLSFPHGDRISRWAPGAVVTLGDNPARATSYPLWGGTDSDGGPYSDSATDHCSILVHRLDDPGHESTGRPGFQVGDVVTAWGPAYPFRLVNAPVHVFVADRPGLVALAPLIAHVNDRGNRWRVHLTESVGSLARVLPGRTDDDGESVSSLPVPSALDALDASTAVYVCADRATIDAVVTATSRSNPEPGRLRLQCAESTHAGPRPVQDHEEASDECVVTAARSGVDIPARRDEPILHALRAADIMVPTSCEAGICGTCETPVLEGAVDHRDEFLTEEEKRAGDTVLVCVSRCASRRLVLDL